MQNTAYTLAGKGLKKCFHLSNSAYTNTNKCHQYSVITIIKYILVIIMATMDTSHRKDRLVGLVVKASTLRAEDPRFESRLWRDFFGVKSYQ